MSVMASMRNRFIALAIATVLVVLGWFLMAFRPAHKELTDLNKSVSQSKAEVVGLQSRLQRLLALKAQAPELRKRLAKFGTAIPTSPKISDFILQVQDVANLSGIDFLTIAPGLPAAPQTVVTPGAPTSGTASTSTVPGTLKAISITLTANGKYFAIEDFVLRLEELKRAVKITTFTLGPGGDSSSAAATGTGGIAPGTSPSLSANMSLSIFMIGKSAPTTAPSTTPGGPSSTPAPSATPSASPSSGT